MAFMDGAQRKLLAMVLGLPTGCHYRNRPMTNPLPQSDIEAPYIETPITKRHKIPSLQELQICWKLTENPVTRSVYRQMIMNRIEQEMLKRDHALG